tara:strand:+ start:88 stop:513 length:426 start_codon:yes stop_codon:yes gene_type:complete
MLSFAAIRKEIALKIGSLSGFKQTNQTPDLFGRTAESIAHKGFAVQMASAQGVDERQRRAIGVYTSSRIIVYFAYRLRPLDAYPTDYDNALDSEGLVINKVLEAYATNNKFTLRYLASNRQVTESQEYIIIQLEFNALHSI